MITLSFEPEWMPFFDVDVGPDDAPWRNLDGKDYARFTPTTAKKLSDPPAAGVALPTGAHYALISVESNPIRFRTSTTAPTAAEGTLLPVGTHKFTNRTLLERFWFIDTAAGASTVTVAYFRRP